MNVNVTRWAFLVVSEARKHKLVPSLVLGLISVESAGDPQAVSSAGAVGLGQILSSEQIPGRPTPAELRDPMTNVQWTCQILAENFARTHTQAGMLAAYYGAISADGRPNAATDGSSVDGWEYVRRVETAAMEYRDLDQRADHDFIAWAAQSGTWREAATNLLGVATDALQTGRRLKADFEMVADAALKSAARWGSR